MINLAKRLVVKPSLIPLLLIVLYLFCAALGYSGSNRKFMGPPFGSISGQDFRVFLRASKEISDGKDPYLNSINMKHSMNFIRWKNREDAPYLYPPILAVLITPLLRIGKDNGLAVWTVVNIFILIFSALLATITFISNNSNRWLWFFAFLTFFFFYLPTQLDIKLGQVDIFVLFFLLLAYYLFVKNSDLAFLPLSLAISIKPFLIFILLFFFWKKRYRMVLYTLFGVGVLLSLGFLRAGISSIYNYIILIRSLSTSEMLLSLPVNQSLTGFFYRVFSTNTYIQPLAHLPVVARILPLVLGGIALILWFIVTDRSSDHGVNNKIDYGLTIVTLMLIYPLAEDIYFIWLLIPLSALLSLLENQLITSRWMLLMIPVIALSVYLGLPDLNDAIYYGWEVHYHLNSLVGKENLVLTGGYIYGVIALEMYILVLRKVLFNESIKY